MYLSVDEQNKNWIIVSSFLFASCYFQGEGDTNEDLQKGAVHMNSGRLSIRI